MSLMENLNTSYKYVVNKSSHVEINYDNIDKLLSKLNTNNITYWLDSNPYNILDMDIEEIVNFLAIYHTIGDYCFWGEPKWTINTKDGQMDGSYAIMYLIINYYKQNKNFKLSRDEFKELLTGNVEIPLFEDRYNNLVTLNEFLQDKSFYNLIKEKTNDIELLEYIINNLPYFEDKSLYKGEMIYFYKRAQLLTSDILHILECKDNKDVDYSHLIGCADYKIPQVMYCYNLLQYDDELSKKVDSMIPIEAESEEEIEIRASDLEIIDYIYNRLEKKYAKMNINDFIWLLSQDKSEMKKPYHRTLTNHY